MRHRPAPRDAGPGIAHLWHPTRLRFEYHAAGAGPVRRDRPRAAGDAGRAAGGTARRRAGARRHHDQRGGGLGGVLPANPGGPRGGGLAHA